MRIEVEIDSRQRRLHGGYTGRAPGWVLAVLGLCAGLTAPVLTGGFSSLVPLVVPPGALARANALDSASYNIGGLAGPALVAAIASTAGPAPALVAVAGVAVAGLAVVMAAPMPPASGDAVRHESLVAALADGLRLLRRSARLASVTVSTTVAQCFQGSLPVLCPLLAVALRTSESGGGWLLTALSAGGLAGALASERLLTWRSARWVLVASLALTGVFLAAMAVTAVFWACVVLAAAAGLAEGPSLAATLDVRQRESPPGRYAQVTATAASFKTGAYALGAAAVGLASGALTARELIALAAAGQLLAVFPLLVYWRSTADPSRRMVPS